MCSEKIYHAIKCSRSETESVILVCEKNFGLKTNETIDIPTSFNCGWDSNEYCLLGAFKNIEKADEEVKKIAEESMPYCDPEEVEKYKSKHPLTEREYDFYDKTDLKVTPEDILKIYFTHRLKPEDPLDLEGEGHFFYGRSEEMIKGGMVTSSSSDDDLLRVNAELIDDENKYEYSENDYMAYLLAIRQELIDAEGEEKDEEEELEHGK